MRPSRRRRQAGALVLGAAVAALPACGSSGDAGSAAPPGTSGEPGVSAESTPGPAEPTEQPEQPEPSATPGAGTDDLGPEVAVSAFGAGPVRAGMTLAQAEEAAGVPFEVQDFDLFEGYCFHAVPEGLQGRLIFLLEAPDDDPLDDPRQGVIGRVSVFRFFDDPDDLGPAPTVEGVEIGDSADRVREVYGDDGLRSEPHVYQPGGEYLVVDEPDSDYRLRFEVGETGVVEAIHGGLEGPVDYVEGCA